MNFKVMAFDDGYGDNKLLSNGNPFLVPSFITPFKPLPQNEFSSSSGFTYYASSVEGKDYTFGDYASFLDSNPQWVGGENKHADKRFPLLFKSCLGLMTNEEVCNVHKMVMGLPVNSHNIKREDQLKNIVEGKHEMEISFDGEVFFERNVHIEELIIKPQPFGSLCDVILDSQGQICNKQVASGFNVIVDIGARTLNILTCHKLQTIDDLTLHTNDGIYTSYIDVGNYLKGELGITIPDGKLPSIIQSQQLNGYDLTPAIQAANENLANNIANIINKTLINSWGMVSTLIFTGGGAEVLKQYLMEDFKSKNTLFLNRFSTVRGFKKYGIRKAIQDNCIDVKVGNYDNRH
ncbi:ParM/StbA family protein [Halobacillus litoralis]|uniref:ParM/StbA family protein n=1 Tax=Halobacillus litoralis TaxID=45668 RepID=UPI001CD7CF85|nr:ParM/StbA family protein [Halobacillus litoralis]MCA1021623.1 ParM/StbA family protein [Halobacillus litoralis]